MTQTNIDKAIDLLGRALECEPDIPLESLYEEIGGALTLLSDDSQAEPEALLSELDIIISTIKRDGRLTYEDKEISYHDALMAAADKCHELAKWHKEGDE